MRISAFLWIGLIGVGSLGAQCVMCREAAASQQSAALEAFQSGIVALAIPLAAGLLFVGRLLRRYSGEGRHTASGPQ